MRGVWSVVAAVGVVALIAGCPFNDAIPTSSNDDSTSEIGTTAVVSVNDEGRPAGWTEETHGNDAAANYAVVFPDDQVNRLDVTIASEDLQAMLEDMAAKYGEIGHAGGAPLRNGAGFADENPIWAPCTVEFEGKTWWYVGIRFKGQSTLKDAWRMGIGKLPFRFDFDEFEDEYPETDDQRFFGFKKLSLANNSHDPSELREKVAHDIFRDAGVPAPRTAFYRVYVDVGEGSTYFGLYTMTEIPDDPMLDAQFGNDDGNLYKPESTWASFDEADFDKKTNEDEADYGDVQAAITALHADRSDAAQWRAGLEAVFDVDGFLRWLAVNTVIQNWDTYGNMAQNCFVYGDTADDGRLTWIPWDNNEALKDGSDGSVRPPLSLELDEVGDNWPLIRCLADDPVYWSTYVAYVRETIEGEFAVEAAQARLQAAHDLIAPYVTGADGEQPGYTFLLNSWEFDTELDHLLDHVEQRNNATIKFLEADHE